MVNHLAFDVGEFSIEMRSTPHGMRVLVDGLLGSESNMIINKQKTPKEKARMATSISNAIAMLNLLLAPCSIVMHNLSG